MQTDGKTPFERLKRKKYLGDVVEFAEMVYVKDPALKQDKLDDRWLGPLAWLGKTDKSDEHICVNAEGDELGFYRSIRRLPEDKRWDKEALKRISVTPWMPKNKSGREPTVRRLADGASIWRLTRLSQLPRRRWCTLGRV